MLLKSNINIRKCLTLVFVASLLLNAQASVACAMMPDMSEQQAECCCGDSHRSPSQTDLVLEQGSMDHASDLDMQGEPCDDPRIGCCMLEVSVGMHDPPDGDEALTFGVVKVDHHKPLKQLDNHTLAIQSVAFQTQVARYTYALTISLHDAFLHHHPPPLYKITERYRI